MQHPASPYLAAIAAIALTISLEGCTTTTAANGTKTAAFDPVAAAQAEQLALKTAQDAATIATEVQQLQAAQKAMTAKK